MAEQAHTIPSADYGGHQLRGRRAHAPQARAEAQLSHPAAIEGPAASALSRCERPSRRARSTAVGGIAMLLLAASAAGSAKAEELANIPPASPDAELLRLGEMLEEAWKRENEAYALATGKDDDTPEAIRADALNEATCAIVRQIEGTPALTLDGLQVKLRAVIWCQSGDPVTAAYLGDGQNPATSTRLLVELLNDLSTMGAPA